jgi:hypothetical protein
MHVYEVRPRKDKRGVDLISNALPFERLWYGEPDAISNAVGYAKFRSRSHGAVIRVCGDAGKVILQKPSIQPRDPGIVYCDESREQHENWQD